MENYKENIINLINQLDLEKDNIKKASKIMYKAMKDNKVCHVFATGHSHMFSEELFYRAGGLVQINPILEPFLMQHEGAMRSTQFERLTGISKIIYDSLDLKEGEPFIIVSNSGINNVPIEMAKICKENNHEVIVITSMNNKDLKSRNDSGKHLYEFGDVVIDNHTPIGDGCIDSKYGKVGATSTVLNTIIAQELVLEIIRLYEEDNLTPPIYYSANNGGDNHNKELIRNYKNRIKCLY